MERVVSVNEDAGDDDGSFWHTAVGGLGTSAVSQDCVKDAPQMILDSDTKSCIYHNASELSSASKLIESLLSPTPVRVSLNSSGVVEPVDLATVEVRMSTEAKSDSARSNACDSECNWGGFSLFIPETVAAVARALVALSRNSAKDLAPTSTHCDCNERAASICICVVDEYSWRLSTSRMNVTSMISNDVVDVPRSVLSSGMEVKVKHTDSCGRARVSRAPKF